MNVPAFNIALKRNILLLLVFISIFVGVETTGSTSPSKAGRRSVTPTGSRPRSRLGRPLSSNNIRIGLGLRNNLRIRTPSMRSSSSPQQHLNQSQQQHNSEQHTPPRSPDRNSGTIDVQTKLILLVVSFFTLIFVIVLLIIGHFTWFADIRKELEEEWQEELRKEEEKRVAKNILSEMVNPFKNLEDNTDADADADVVEVRRRESVDSNGCTRGLCVPPHHSILCPNNPNIPKLNEPFPLASPSLYKIYSASEDPIDYRNSQRRSTDWMNLESSVRVSEPVPMRDRMMSYSMAFMHSLSKRPMTPLTPDPAASTSLPLPLPSPSADLDRDLEAGKFTEQFNLKSPPSIKFDLSKLDLI